MIKKSMQTISKLFPAPPADAHCDGPCGVYDPASARIAAEAVVSMTNKMLALEKPDSDQDPHAMASYLNTMSRYINIKEEQAQLAKTELLILWTDFFKPPHLEKHPDLHDLFWNAAKLCSAVKVEVNPDKCTELMETIEKIHKIFWAAKDRDIAWYTAS